MDIQDMIDAEESPAHLTVYNYQHKPMDWLLAQLQGEGYDPYCFNSALVNGETFHPKRNREAHFSREGKGPLQTGLAQGN